MGKQTLERLEPARRRTNADDDAVAGRRRLGAVYWLSRKIFFFIERRQRVLRERCPRRGGRQLQSTKRANRTLRSSLPPGALDPDPPSKLFIVGSEDEAAVGSEVDRLDLAIRPELRSKAAALFEAHDAVT